MISRFAVAASLALALAACGSSNEPSSESTTTATTSTEAPDAAVTEAVPSEAPSTAAATPSPASAPTPNASASAAADESESTTGASASPPQAFNQCAACHSTEPGKTIIGPSLAGVYGTKAGQTPGFQFSSAMKNSGMVLDAADLDKFLADPKGTVPGTIMAFAGLKDASQRKAVIAYLKTLK